MKVANTHYQMPLTKNNSSSFIAFALNNFIVYDIFRYQSINNHFLYKKIAILAKCASAGN